MDSIVWSDVSWGSNLSTPNFFLLYLWSLLFGSARSSFCFIFFDDECSFEIELQAIKVEIVNSEIPKPKTLPVFLKTPFSFIWLLYHITHREENPFTRKDEFIFTFNKDRFEQGKRFWFDSYNQVSRIFVNGIRSSSSTWIGFANLLP